MDVNTLIEAILNIPTTNSKAVKLKSSLVKILRSNQGLRLHRGEVNLTFLADLVGCTRQCFYPGRGHDDMRAIVTLLNTHAMVLANHSSSSTKPKPNKLNVTLHKALSENETLKRELNKNKARWNNLYNQRLIVD